MRFRGVAFLLIGLSVAAFGNNEKDSTIASQHDSALMVDAIDTIVVAGKRVSKVLTSPRLESPGLQLSVSEVTRSDMKAQDAHTVVDAVNLVPGALTESRGRKVKQFVSFRGQQYPYPTYSLDGAWQREFLELPYFFSTADIERIEVLRSSAALLNGLSGLSGVINIVTSTPRLPQTNTDISYGTYGTWHGNISSSASLGKWSYHYGLAGWNTEGPVEKHAAEQISNGFGKITYMPIEKLTLQASLFHLYGKRKLAQAEAPAQQSLRTNDETFDPLRATNLNLKAFYRWNDKMSTELLGYRTDRSHRFETTVYSSIDSVFKSGLLVSADSVYKKTSTPEDDYEWGINSTHAFSPLSGNILRVGGLYNHWIAPNGKRFYVGKKIDQQTISAVVMDEQEFGKFSIDGAMRWAQTYNGDFSPIHEADLNGDPTKTLQEKNVRQITDEWDKPQLTVSLGSAYRVAPWLSFHANAAGGSIKPRTGALDTSHNELDDETRVMIDVGVKGMIERLGSLSIVGFYTDRKNGIEMSGTLDTFTRIEYYANRTSDNYGMECELRTGQFKGIGAGFINIAYIVSRFQSGNGDFEADTTKPDLIIGGGVMLSRYGFDVSIFGKHVTEYFSNRFASQQDIQKGVMYQLGDYASADVTAGYTFGPKGAIRLYAAVHNILDRKFSTVLGYPDNGRAFNGGIQYVIR